MPVLDAQLSAAEVGHDLSTAIDCLALGLSVSARTLVMVLDGRLKLTIGGTEVIAAAGTIVRMPAHVPHAVDAIEPSRMLLTSRSISALVRK